MATTHEHVSMRRLQDCCRCLIEHLKQFKVKAQRYFELQELRTILENEEAYNKSCNDHEWKNNKKSLDAKLARKSATLFEKFLELHRELETMLEGILDYSEIKFDRESKFTGKASHKWHVNLIAAFKTAPGDTLYDQMWYPLREILHAWRIERHSIVSSDRKNDPREPFRSEILELFPEQCTVIGDQMQNLITDLRMTGNGKAKACHYDSPRAPQELSIQGSKSPSSDHCQDIKNKFQNLFSEIRMQAKKRAAIQHHGSSMALQELSTGDLNSQGSNAPKIRSTGENQKRPNVPK